MVNSKKSIAAMKNLFKNLMLVAVAAMAFTSCSQDVNELNKLEKKTTFEFVASFDGDTRSGFTGSSEDENGTVMYHSEWFGGETVMLVAGDQVVTATVDTEGKFSATFEGEISQIDVYTPMDSFYKPYMDYNIYQVNPAVLAEQTPLTNSVDPKAHVAKGYVMVDADGNQTIPVSLTHDVAYGKMTVKGVDFEIDHVVVDLKGSFFGSARELSYTINAANVENNTFWFATEPIEVAEFTVTAYDAEGTAVTKSVDVAAAGKTLAFNYGRVSTFSVSDLKVVEEKYDSTYAYVYEDYGANDKEIMFVADDNRALRIDFYNVYEDNCIVPGTYTFEGTGFMYPGWCYYYEDVNGYYTSKLNGGQAVVSLEDGQYKIVFTNMAYNETVYVDKFTFKGKIDDIDYPDPRTKLAAPNVTAQITGKTIILDWESVTGADSYLIEIYSDAETVEPVSTTDTHFEYTVKSYDSYYSFDVTAVVAEDNAEYRNSGYSSKVEYSDPREQLPAPTNVSATVDGLNVTISWDKVENAVGYEINYYDNGNITKSTTETSITLEMSTYNNEYYFYLSSVADENSDSYRSSDDAYTTVVTGMDPNGPIAEYMASNLYWNSSAGAFEFVVDHYEIFRVKMNSADCPDHTTILEGEYKAVASSTIPVESFSVYQKVKGGFAEGYSSTNTSSSMSVSYVDGEYVIIVDYIGKWGGSGEVGYKGVPEGWVVPGDGDSGDGGDDSGDDNTGDGGDSNEPGSESNPYTFASVAVNNFFLNFEGAENGASLQLDRQNSDVSPMVDKGAPFYLNDTTIIYAGSGNLYTVGATSYSYAQFAPYSTLHVTKANGVYTCNLKISVDGVTYTYYTFTGSIANQPY